MIIWINIIKIKGVGETMLYITSSSNQTIKEIRGLYRRKERWARRLFIAEGYKIVEECIDNNYPLAYTVMSDGFADAHNGMKLPNKLAGCCTLIKVPNKLFKEISDTENTQGILAVARFKEYCISNVYQKPNPLMLFLDQIQDPGNMGTIIRTADAFGIDGIIVIEGSVDVYNPKVVRATMGSIFRVPIFHYSNAIEIVKDISSRGVKIYSTSIKYNTPIQRIDWNAASMVIIGNEAKGVSKDLQALADDSIGIEMKGKAESLNAAIAASIIMYEFNRERC